MARLIASLVDAQARWSKPFGDFNQRWLKALFGAIPAAKDFLNGTWLGHPVHAMLTDVPVGAYTVLIVLDLLNLRAAADVALVIGILSMAAAALAGLADYTDTDLRPRDWATVHGTLMVIALLVYLVSLAIRVGNPVDRTGAVILSIVGYLLVAGSAYVGGHVAYAFGNMVSRHAFRFPSSKWVALDVTEVPEATPTKAKAGAQSLVLVRSGESVLALHEVCSHAGGFLSEGKLVDGCIQCPLHGSRFRLGTGEVTRGPAVYPQPRYEVRLGENGYEARRIPE